MATTRDLLKALETFNRDPESRGYELRLSLADLIIEGLRRRGWTQKQLAQLAGMKQSFVTRIVHAGSNCTFDVAGRLLFALGIEAAITEVGPESPHLVRSEVVAPPVTFKAQWTTHGKEEIRDAATTNSRVAVGT